MPSISIEIWISKLISFQVLYDMIIASIVAGFVYSLLEIAMIHLFSGWPCMESCGLVRSEREWDTYFNGLTSF